MSKDVQKGCSTTPSDLLHGGHKLGSEGQAARQQAMLHLCVHFQLLVHGLGKQQAHHEQHLCSNLSTRNAMGLLPCELMNVMPIPG